MSVLRRYYVGALIAALFAAPVQAQNLPSGQSVTLSEVLIDDVNGESWLRFRFVAPQIARTTGDISYDEAGPDMERLCADLAIPYIAEYELKPDAIVISLADQEIEFGESNPDVTQFFDVFRVKNDTCIWEAF